MADQHVFTGIDQDVRARRAASFGANAAAYAAERPDYPEAAVDWALAPVADRSPLRVLDLGAGTGKLTESLARRAGVEVIAVEPDEAMRAQLQQRLPEVRALSGSAESIPLPDGSVDAILVGQALHWFDLDKALPEMARVLAPAGVLAGLWNLDDDQVEWVRGMKQVARSAVSFTNWRPVDIPVAGSHFGPVEQERFAHGQRRTAASMVATIATHSHVITLAEPERTALLTDLADYLAAAPETSDGEFVLPIVTVVVRTQRL